MLNIDISLYGESFFISIMQYSLGVSLLTYPILTSLSAAFCTLLSLFERTSNNRYSSTVGNTLFRYLSMITYNDISFMKKIECFELKMNPLPTIWITYLYWLDTINDQYILYKYHHELYQNNGTFHSKNHKRKYENLIQ